MGVKGQPTSTASTVFSGDTAESILSTTLKHAKPLFIGPRMVLSESWTPSRLVHREQQIRELTQILYPACNGDRPSNVLVYGDTGTGKTAVVTKVVEAIKKKADTKAKVETIYVNCKFSDTTYGVLRELVNALQDPSQKQIGQKLGTHILSTELRRLSKARGGLLLVVLDEIDLLVKQSGDDSIYLLLELNTQRQQGGVCVIGVSNDLKFEERLGARVQSRLNEQHVLFHRYTQVQLVDILKDRAKIALSPRALEPGLIEYCAAYAAQQHGDARHAITLFRTAVQLTEKEGAPQVTLGHVKCAEAEIELDIIGGVVKGFPFHQKLTLFTVLALHKRNRAPVSTGTVYEAYQNLCDRVGAKPATHRSVFNYLAELETTGLISVRAVNRGAHGRTSEIQPTVNVDSTMKVIQESEAFLRKDGEKGSEASEPVQKSLDGLEN
ncbi:MAG: AAA family ATPase [Candidatus Thermoplasmatota archaeon]|jgi:cell division control protein 6|nr:AAA family ATPase [Candidatus Thermoplasmatota archaeon]MDG6912974.1 AAA family ATPase [Nitrososphaerota archaeon]